MEFEKTVILEKAGTLSKYISYSERRKLHSLKISSMQKKDKLIINDIMIRIYNYLFPRTAGAGTPNSPSTIEGELERSGTAVPEHESM